MGGLLSWFLQPTRRAVAGLAVLWLLFMPVSEFVYYDTALRRGEFPPEADSIMIPLTQFGMGWLLFLPFISLVLWLALGGAPRRIALAAFDRRRWWWSLAWTAGLGWCAGKDLWFAATSVVRHYPLDVVQGLLGAYVFLAVRAALCSPSPTPQAAAPAPAA